jgi:hypothetical protein
LRRLVDVDIVLPMPRVSLCRQLYLGAGLAGPYADGPNFWWLAYEQTVGALRHSCSDWHELYCLAGNTTSRYGQGGC